MARHLCIGPPGCGKTTFGISLVEEAISKGIPPTRILYSTFTRAGAYHARVLAIGKFPQYSESDFPLFRTIHAIAFRLLGLNTHAMFDGRKLKEFANTFKYKFSDDALDKDIFQQDIVDMGIGTEADAYLAFDDWRKNKLILDIDVALSEFAKNHFELPRDFSPRALKLFLQRKDEWKSKEGVWEFSDLLLKVYQDKIPLDVDLVVVDEAQDNSPLLHAVVETWARNAKEFYLLGDANQAIYSFMGSDPSIMLNWKRDEDIVLKQSYRCSKAVHDLSRKVAARMKVRYSDDDFIPTQNDGMVSRVQLPKLDFNGSGLTYLATRTRYLLDRHYDYLLSKGIPFTVKRGKQSPLDKDESAAVQSLYRLSEGDAITMQELHKLMKFIPQGPYIKRGAKTEITERAKDNPEHKISKVSLPALGFTTDFAHLIDSGEYTETLKLSPGEKRYYRLLLKKYGAQALVDEPRLVLGTIHSFKGLEADRVVLDLTMTRLPYENLLRNPDEELRCFYVGITRAKTEVDLLMPDDWRGFPL